MRFEEARIDRETFPLHALTQRSMPMYQSWHAQNAWLRQIIGYNRLFVNRALGLRLGLAEDDWVWLSSHHGRIRVPTRLVDGVNRDTVWTWNAIGKHAGAWNLDPASPEFRRGFLLNHLISELLPADGGFDYANTDPITGQAAWYDLRVRIDRAAPIEAGETLPYLCSVRAPGGTAAAADPALRRKGCEAHGRPRSGTADAPPPLRSAGIDRIVRPAVCGRPVRFGRDRGLDRPRRQENVRGCRAWAQGR
jgi:hypothetical protein